MSARAAAEVWPVLGGVLWAGVVLALARRARPPARVRALVGDSIQRRSSDADEAGAAVGAAGRAVVVSVAVASRFGRGLRRLLGRPADPALDRRLGVAAVVAGLVALVAPWLGLVLGAIAWLTPWAVAHRADGRRRDRILEELPDVVDLLRLALGAGYSLRLAIVVVADRTAGIVGDALDRVHIRLERGQRLGDALAELESLGEAAGPLLDGLRGADQLGAPLLPVLARLSLESRGARRRRAEERARRVPIKLLFPLVFCTLPAFGLLTVVPLLASALGHLSF
jgi:tight adherence protein C